MANALLLRSDEDVWARLGKSLVRAVSAVVFLTSTTGFEVQAQALSATVIMERNFEVTRFESSRYVASLEIGRPGAKPRILLLTGTTKLIDDNAANAQLVRFTAPADLKGTATLTINRRISNDDLWVYLPALKRQRRLISSNRRDSYIGSQFSYGDILGYEPEEWEHAALGEAEIDGEACWIIESIPVDERTGRDFGYSKRISWVRKSNYVLKKGEYFDLSGRLLKTIVASDVESFDSAPRHFQPYLVSVTNAQSDRASTLRFLSFDPNSDVRDAEVAPGALDP